ncbi:hypothetical protein BD311DRAFT_197416 [Dichomitus squalens]|uniref:Uncharacterized protein n=1 Tax=Dichomitus squalens TaxID=114155 RepID=A0A4V2K225_9APHY|nr:hypothetical protein BD311DRAFT_197416 [Dichomitus squalens]
MLGSTRQHIAVFSPIPTFTGPPCTIVPRHMDRTARSMSQTQSLVQQHRPKFGEKATSSSRTHCLATFVHC